MGNNKSFTWLGDIIARQEQALNGKLTIGVKEYIGGTSLEDCQGVRLAAYIDGVEKNPKVFQWALDESYDNIGVTSLVGNTLMVNPAGFKFRVRCSVLSKQCYYVLSNMFEQWQGDLSNEYGIDIVNIIEAYNEWSGLKDVFEPNASGAVACVKGNAAAYVVTDFTPSTASRILAKYRPYPSPSAYGRIFGAGSYSASDGLNVDYESNSLKISWFGASAWTTLNVALETTRIHTYDVDKNVFKYDGGKVASTSYPNTITASHPMGLFAANSTTAPTDTNTANGAMNIVAAYEDGVIQRLFVPFTRNNVVGFLDLVSNQFYAPTTSVFTITYES